MYAIPGYIQTVGRLCKKWNWKTVIADYRDGKHVRGGSVNFSKTISALAEMRNGEN
jgi:hypothetical protein